MPNLTFHPAFHAVVLLAIALLAVLLVTVCYRQAYRGLGSGRWALLFALRILAIGIVVLLLLQPVFRVENHSQQRNRVIFLVDRSASMSVADNASGITRWQQSRDQLRAWWPDLNAYYDLQLYVFSDSAEQLDNLASLDALQPTGKATSISRALIAARHGTAERTTEAVVLISDGIQNAAGNPARTARRLGMRVYAIGVGDPLHQRSMKHDVRITDLNCPESIAVNNRCRITGFIEATGMPGRVVEVQLREDDQEVDRKTLTLDDVEGAQKVVLEFVPTRKGLHTYMLQVPKQTGEDIPQNNARSASALVHDARIRVLYLEGTLRQEYGALVGRFLSKDPNIEFCALIQTRPGFFVQRSNIEGLQLKAIPADLETLKTFNVFLIGDLDSTFLSKHRMELIKQRVTDGAGIIMIGGYHSLGPGGYGESILQQILPVRMGTREIGQATDLFQPQLTRDGRRHPIFANIATFFGATDNSSTSASLPPLNGCVKIAGAKSGATILLVHPTLETDGKPMAVMAVQPVGKGRAAVFTADTTRNWHQTLKAMDKKTPFLRFWGQTMRWLAGRDDAVQTEAGIVATTDRAYYAPATPIIIRATVRSDDGVAASDVNPHAVIQTPQHRTTQLNLAKESGPPGHYSAHFDPPRSGRYEITVSARLKNKQLTAPKLQVDVGRPNLEFDRLDLDEKRLVSIANDSGGQYLHISLAERLTEQLKRAYTRQIVQIEIPLAWPPLLWGLFVVALVGEWLLRRRYQLR